MLKDLGPPQQTFSFSLVVYLLEGFTDANRKARTVTTHRKHELQQLGPQKQK